MKRWILLLAAAMLTVLLLAACGEKAPEPTAAPTEPPAQLHTVAPSTAQPEPEWAHVDAAMTLEDAENLYAKGSDFVSFALIGNADSAEIRFRLDDVTAAMLRDQSPDIAYYLTMNGKKIGDAKLNKNCDEVTLAGDYSYEKLCELADTIRGFN